MSMLLISTTSFSQVGIFQHLNEIRKGDDKGELKKMDSGKGYYYYSNEESTMSVYGYILTEDLYCYMTVVKPNSSISLQSWVQNLNQKWVIINDTKWMFYREDGNILECNLDSEDNEMILVFSIKKFAK